MERWIEREAKWSGRGKERKRGRKRKKEKK
jgi:hypothetical protein